jgi:hypothetical protein
MYVREVSVECLWKKYDDQFHQHYIGHDHEQRGQDNGTCSGSTDARSASLSPHSLKARDQPDDQTEYSGLERRWQEIVETGPFEAVIDELME